ncbi:ParB N-terminal domain-containing protein [uncultured Oscillibacter sp.]|uniref:ParB N-terminal domain-containing protein n=1 Tax=uncultured Oscillibacter sp. TaxID=876091 RepID=UPI00262FF002|nr:ParB N-terminal domain-containing protein [uncultured Oscillibacter sp.]
MEENYEGFTYYFFTANQKGGVGKTATALNLGDGAGRKRVPFSTADIGFRPYTPAQLEAFAEQLKEVGLLARIIVRLTAPQGSYEIPAGHNRASAAGLAGWDVIPAEIAEADDARAIVIATSTNLIQRQNLSIVSKRKRGVYRAWPAAVQRP